MTMPTRTVIPVIMTLPIRSHIRQKILLMARRIPDTSGDTSGDASGDTQIDYDTGGSDSDSELFNENLVQEETYY